MAHVTERGASEAHLVVLARGGDSTAFEELVRRRQGAVRSLLRRLSGDAALGDDLAQETFIQAWRTFAQLRVPGAFGGWLRRIAVSMWLRHARRVRLPMEAIDDHEIASPGGMASAGSRIDLEMALARLRPPERLCVVLAYAEGMSHHEIARATNMPLGTVKSHVARGSAKLREWLEADTVKPLRSSK